MKVSSYLKQYIDNEKHEIGYVLLQWIIPLYPSYRYPCILLELTLTLFKLKTSRGNVHTLWSLCLLVCVYVGFRFFAITYLLDS
jgi:hypothetical protein